MNMKKIFVVLMAIVLSVGVANSAEKKLRIGLLVKNLGNSFFDACRDGALDAAKELGNVEVIYLGPSTPTAEGQIEMIDAWIAQKVDGIAISANDKDALVPICKKALKKGIKVISFDSGIDPAGRLVDLVPSSTEYIGRSQVKMITEMIGNEGEIAILSASSQATNQNAWIEYMKIELKEPEYKNMKLVATVYGDDLADKSYREALGLFKTYPNLKGIISPTTVGIAAAGKAIEDSKLKGKVQLTGLGLPSQMKEYIKNGTCKKMSLWNPIDLGYSAIYITYKLIKNQATGKPGETIEAGKMGGIKVGNDGIAVMGAPYVFTSENIEKFASIY